MSDTCLVRQPIFDRKKALLGYEIRYRDSEDGRSAFTESFLTGMFDVVRGGLPAFVTCSREQILERAFLVSDPSTVIVLVPGDVDPDPDIVDALAELRAAGGRVALDDLSEEVSASEGLATMADWARVDMRCDDADIIRRISERLPKGKVRRIADHVLDKRQYDMALTLGFDALSGPYFSRAEPLPSTRMPSSTIAAIRLLGMARDERASDTTLEGAIALDPVLTFQLLRLVNSASIGARGVESIGHALRLIGRTACLRWLSLAVAASQRTQSGVDQHLVRQAVERGRLLEQLAGGERDPSTLFLVGMFSLIDGVFRMPLQDILAQVALSDDAKEALLDRTGPYADALAFAEAYELGMFETAAELAETMSIPASRIPELYASAIEWTADALSGLAGPEG